MKIIGEKSLVSWIKYPFLVYVVIFCTSSVWISYLIISYLLSGKLNPNISEKVYTINDKSYNILQLKYPYSNMVLTADHSTEGLLLALLSLLSLCFIFICASRIINHLASETVFTVKVIKSFKVLSYGLIFLGIVTLLVDLGLENDHFDFTPPFLYIVIGVILLFIKEIFVQGNDLQEQTDLTI